MNGEVAGVASDSTGTSDRDRRQTGRRRASADAVEMPAHASTARPLSANMPRGRFWMNRMIMTRSGDLALNGADHRLEDLVGDADHQRPERGSPKVADAAEHHDHEAVDDVALAEVRRDVVDLGKRDAGNSGDA